MEIKIYVYNNMDLSSTSNEDFLSLFGKYIDAHSKLRNQQDEVDTLDGSFPSYTMDIATEAMRSNNVPMCSMFSPFFVYKTDTQEIPLRVYDFEKNLTNIDLMPNEMGEAHYNIEKELLLAPTDHDWLEQYGLTPEQRTTLEQQIQEGAEQQGGSFAHAYYSEDLDRTPREHPERDRMMDELNIMGDLGAYDEGTDTYEDPYLLLDDRRTLFGFSTSRADMEEFLQNIRQNVNDIYSQRQSIGNALAMRFGGKAVSFVDDMNLPLVEQGNLVAVPQDLEAIPALEK